ncbi:MAG: hypothetical protein WBC82_00315 [Dehalococcoidia bacterium]
MKTKQSVTEAKLQGYCATYFNKQGFLTREEVPFLFKVADLFCFNEETGECIAVEVKIKNWREALEQALVYQMMADKVYIALYEDNIKAVDCGLLTSKSIGLLRVNGSGKIAVILEAFSSPRRMPHFVSKVVAITFPGKGSLACLTL